jgi:hypothetical protein
MQIEAMLVIFAVKKFLIIHTIGFAKNASKNFKNQVKSFARNAEDWLGRKGCA